MFQGDWVIEQLFIGLTTIITHFKVTVRLIVGHVKAVIVVVLWTGQVKGFLCHDLLGVLLRLLKWVLQLLYYRVLDLNSIMELVFLFLLHYSFNLVHQWIGLLETLLHLPLSFRDSQSDNVLIRTHIAEWRSWKGSRIQTFVLLFPSSDIIKSIISLL